MNWNGLEIPDKQSGGSLMVKQLSFPIKEGGSIPTSPLQMTIREISVFTACKLNELWHSRLPIIHWSNIVRNTYYICYGAYFESEWYAIAIWSDPIARNRLLNGDKTLELRRQANSSKAPKYTSSWMLGIMRRLIRKRFPEIKKLISYQDTEVHLGTIYRAAGWKIGYYSKGRSWSTDYRKRNIEQTLADKIRWECLI